MTGKHACIVALTLALSSSIALGEGNGSVTATSNRVDVAERRVQRLTRNFPSTTRASVPALTRELRDLERESLAQPNQLARRNDVRLRALRRELFLLGASPHRPVIVRAVQYDKRRTRLITPEIPIVDLEAEWQAQQRASSAESD